MNSGYPIGVKSVKLVLIDDIVGKNKVDLTLYVRWCIDESTVETRETYDPMIPSWLVQSRINYYGGMISDT